jgi:hypothetical protein
MTTSLKHTENEVYSYLNRKFRVGWNLKTVTEYYRNLNYQERDAESKRIFKELNSQLNESDWNYLQDETTAFSIREFSKTIHKNKDKELLEVAGGPTLAGFAGVKWQITKDTDVTDDLN